VTLLYRFASIVRWLVRRNSAEQDLDDDVHAFVDMAAADRMREGVSPADARRMAVLDLGGVEQTKERVRSARSGAWLDEIGRDVRYALRMCTRSPGFSAVVIITLALGIGANTAIFSLWYHVLHASLPGVNNPAGLVMLTDPDASGMLYGRWNSRSDGPRAWLSYVEFEQLRDHASSFAALMASQSELNTWQVRVAGGAAEEASGRLVSGGFFEALGVRPAIGHLLTANEDHGETASAVISYAYWQRRFGGRLEALGETLTVRNTPVTIVGVTTAGFVGETSGQQPDLWLPLRLQPRILPGADWLEDKSPDKVMWLHVFGRLKPGVTAAQAETEANAVFQTGLKAFYGETSGERLREVLDQRLRIRPGGRGASATRDDLSSSLSMLVVSVGLLLLIACVNLANLFLARAAARQSEIAVRASLGATRARLIRQLVTESLMLATIGAVAGVALASVMHGALVRMLQEAEPRLVVGFSLTRPVLALASILTVAAVLVFGVLPAWQATRNDVTSRLKDGGRGAVGSTGELRSGRWLVGVQLALSLPLLVCAGLLMRTIDNLQHVDVGFHSERLLLARVDLSEIVQDTARRDRVLRDLHARIRRVPGVQTVSFSQLGLFSGGFSSATIEVEGSALTADTLVESALDRVGADYFTTLGIPIRLGRDISTNDRADTVKVCVINDAFARRFFSGRDPIGMHVTTIDDNARTTYEVVGIAGDARIQDLRREVEARFFVPAEQRRSLGTSRTFLIRALTETAAVAAAVRQAVTDVDAPVSLSSLAFIEQQMAPLTAEERVIARLTVVFGSVALALAAIGLYGVLSFGIVRRSSEIAIRIALGAQSRGIVTMILRETLGLVVAGLLLGGALAYVGSRLVASRLYRVGPQDPLTLIVATAVLLVVALLAACLPAYRASRMDPMAALHQG
jgi:predicted permease